MFLNIREEVICYKISKNLRPAESVNPLGHSRALTSQNYPEIIIVLGAGDGQFGIWFDDNLNHGRSQSCQTFDNPPLTPAQDFR